MTIAEPLVAGAPDLDATPSVPLTAGGQAEPEAALAAASRAEVAGGVRWSLLATVAIQVGRFGFSVVLMRLLGPENFGIVAQAMVYIAFTGLFLNLGLAATIIQRPRLEREDIGSAFWLNLGIGVALAVLTVIVAPALASFFHTDGLTTVLRVLAVSLVLKAAAVVPTALLTRRMHFRDLGRAEVSAMVVSGVAGVLAASYGAGYWALVVQTLVFDVFYLSALLWGAGLPAMAWSRDAVRRLWSFSSRVMGANVINYVSDNTDKVLIARALGPTPLAVYTLAFRVLVVPVEIFAKTTGQVLFPMYSRLEQDRERIARLFLDASQATALVVSPMMILAILSAPLGIPMVFGDAWTEAVVPLQLLAVHGVFFVLVLLTGPVVLAAGRADWELRWAAVTTIVAVMSFAVGLQWGIVGVAASYLVLNALLDPIRFVTIQRLIPVSVGGYLRALAPAASSSVVLVGSWFATASALRGSASDLGVLVGAGFVSLAAYIAATKLLWSTDFRRQADFARLVVRPRSAS